VDERTRQAQYGKLEEVLGEEATTLMEHLPRSDGPTLPPSGTSRTWPSGNRLEHQALGERFRLEHEALGERFRLQIEATEDRVVGRLHRELAAQTRTFFLGMIGSVVTVGGLAVAAARF
jgi:hypothetical protein